jgi:hypothetical protein
MKANTFMARHPPINVCYNPSEMKSQFLFFSAAEEIDLLTRTWNPEINRKQKTLQNTN